MGDKQPFELDDFNAHINRQKLLAKIVNEEKEKKDTEKKDTHDKNGQFSGLNYT